MKNLPALIAICACLAACASTESDPSGSAAGDPMASGEIPSFLEPIEYFPKALGPLSWEITTDSETAQAYFNQGLQLRYAYGVDEAARSFHEARLADPDCAMCYWGEAYALGSYLNAAISVEKAPYAFDAIQTAAELAETNATQMEKDLIAATLIRYPDNYSPSMKPELDQAFADAMREVYEEYPDDLNIIAIYASSIFLLEPRRGTRDLDDPDVIRLHAVLQDGLTQDITHPGLCHMFVHATESTVRPDLAEPCAEYLGTSIPGASHINHMPSHTWNEVGRWGDSVRANLMAWHSDQKAAIGEGVPIYPWHNVHMLLFAASMDGQGAIAIQAAKDYAKIRQDRPYHQLTLIRFGRFDEVAAAGNRPDDEIGAGLWDFSMGYAKLREGDIDGADETASQVLGLADTTEAMFGIHPGRLILGTVGHILAGEIQRAEGNLDAAITTFEQGVALEDQLEYAEPEPLPFAARHWLGAALMEAGRFEDAEQVYREELSDHPHNVWSLHGLRGALAAQNRQDSAVDEDFLASTARSDTWITQSRF
jgi:tetratricopeptide (TPR) repeat protein